MNDERVELGLQQQSYRMPTRRSGRSRIYKLFLYKNFIIQLNSSFTAILTRPCKRRCKTLNLWGMAAAPVVCLVAAYTFSEFLRYTVQEADPTLSNREVSMIRPPNSIPQKGRLLDCRRIRSVRIYPSKVADATIIGALCRLEEQ